MSERLKQLYAAYDAYYSLPWYKRLWLFVRGKVPLDPYR